MLLGDPACDREPQTGAARLLRTRGVHAVEPLEDMRLMLRGDTDTVVRERHRDGFAVLCQDGRRTDVASGRRVLPAVFEEYTEKLTQEDRIGTDHRFIVPVQNNLMRARHHLHLFHRVGENLREKHRLLVHRLTLLVGTRKKEQFFDELLHILRLRADRRDALLEDVLVLTPPAREHVRVSEDDRQRRAQLMGGIRDKPLLLDKALLQTLKHAVERTRQLRELVARARDRETLSEALHLDAARRPRDRANWCQNAPADEMPCDECEYKADRNGIEEQPLQRVEKILFRCNRAEKMNPIGGATILERALGMVDRAVAELGDLHLGVCPERRLYAPLLNRRIRREVRIRIENNPPRIIRDPHDHAGDYGTLEPELCLSCISALDVVHHMTDTAVEINLCLPIKKDVCAHPQNRCRKNKHEKEDGGIHQCDLG